MDRLVLLMRIGGGSAVVRLLCYPVSLLFASGGDAQAIGVGRSAVFGILIGLLFLGLATVPVEVKASNAHGGESTVEISATVTAQDGPPQFADDAVERLVVENSGAGGNAKPVSGSSAGRPGTG